MITCEETYKSNKQIDFAKAVFETIIHVCPHGTAAHKFCKNCYNHQYKKRTKKIRNRENLDKYHEQHPYARFNKKTA